MSLINQYCVSMENLTLSDTCPWISQDICPWIGRDVYRQNVINDVINKVCLVFICILYLFCILYSVFCKLLYKIKN